jgi:hypothetical protein
MTVPNKFFSYALSIRENGKEQQPYNKGFANRCGRS